MASSKQVVPKNSNPIKVLLTAKQFLEGLQLCEAKNGTANARYFSGNDKNNQVIGVRMSAIFALAKELMQMPLAEIEKLLNSKFYEARIGAVSIMDFQARCKKTTEARKKELYDLYIRKHDRINNWDMVDRSAPYVVGGYLYNRSRKPLYRLAKSKKPLERRTAIVSTYFFIRQNEIAETFAIAELLVNDTDELVNKAVGSWIREAGKRDPEQLLAFLSRHAATMPRITLRYAIEKLSSREKSRFMKIK